jgi:hypothetical protein
MLTPMARGLPSFQRYVGRLIGEKSPFHSLTTRFLAPADAVVDRSSVACPVPPLLTGTGTLKLLIDRTVGVSRSVAIYRQLRNCALVGMNREASYDVGHQLSLGKLIMTAHAVALRVTPFLGIE